MAVRAVAIVKLEPQNDFTFRYALQIFAQDGYREVQNDHYFQPDDSEEVVKVELYRFVTAYILSEWSITLGVDDTVRIFNPYVEISPVVALSNKFKAFWNMTEDTGTQRADSVGTDDLTESGTVSREATSDGSWAALFDGTGAALIGNTNITFSDFDFMVSFWAKYDDNSANATFLQAWSLGLGRSVFEVMRRNDTGMLEFQSDNGATYDLYTSTFFIDASGSVWNSIVLWYEAATDTVSIQMNASAVQTFVLTTPIQGTADYLRVGTGAPGHFKGAMRRLGYGRFNPTTRERAMLFNYGQGQDWPINNPVAPPIPSGSGYVLITDGIQSEVAADVDVDHLPVASTTSRGVVELAVQGETTAGLAIQASDWRLSDNRTPIATAAGLDLLADASAAEQRDTLGLGALATEDTVGAHAASHQEGGSDEVTPLAHAASHQNGGTDEISVQLLSGLLADGQTPLAHAVSHQPGGGDEITHAASHQNAGADEISVAGLSGLLADGQTPLAHAATHHAAGSDPLAIATADIVDDAVTYAKLQNVSATDRLLGRDTAAAGNAEELTVSLGLEFTGAGGIQRSALTGDVTANAGSNVLTIADDAVTFAKFQNVGGDILLGRASVGLGNLEEIWVTSAGRALLDDGSEADQRTTLGLGAMALKATIATADLDNGAVTYAKMQDVSATARVLGRITAGAGDPEELTFAQVQNTAYCFLAANDARSVTAKNDMAGMAFALAANTDYSIHFKLLTTSNAAGVGVQFALTFDGTITYAQFNAQAPGAATTLIWITDTGASPFLFDFTASQGNVPGTVEITGTIEVGASGGTLQLQHGSETISLTTVIRGSWGMCAQHSV